MKDLTPKQAKFVEGIVEGKSGAQAVRDAGYKVKNRHVAKSIASENLTKPYLSERLELVLADLQINVRAAAQPISDALQADKVIVHGKGSEESWVDIVPDHSIRLQASDRAFRLMDRLQKSTEPVKQQIIEGLHNADEIELQRILFKQDKG